jgi:UDP-N-acetylmuramoylalanine--D-glutamate ligase
LPEWARGAVTVYAANPEMREAADFDVVVKSPGVPPRTPGIQAALDAGRVVTSPTRLWFAETAGLPVIGVTGTKGKGTTATLLHRCLAAAGKNAHLVGNIGRAAIEVLPITAGADPIFVVELSSFQLWDLDVSPPLAVLLNLYTDHLDWHGTREDYVAAKLNVARYQREGDVLVHHGTDAGIRATGIPGSGRRVPYCVASGVHVEGGRFVLDGTGLFATDRVKLRGAHNLDNVCAALTVLVTLGYDPTRFESVIAEFTGLPHRLQTVAWVDGAEYVDDSIATGPDAAVRSMDAFPDRRKAIVLGGNDKGIPQDPLVDRLMRDDVVGVVLIQQAGERLAALLAKRGRTDLAVRRAADLTDAVGFARELVPAGGVVLLAPGAASAPPHRDYADRGDRFRDAVLALDSVKR